VSRRHNGTEDRVTALVARFLRRRPTPTAWQRWSCVVQPSDAACHLAVELAVRDVLAGRRPRPPRRPTILRSAYTRAYSFAQREERRSRP
jgi:hypothetical protein